MFSVTYAINSKTGREQWTSGIRSVHMYTVKASEEIRREGLSDGYPSVIFSFWRILCKSLTLMAFI